MKGAYFSFLFGILLLTVISVLGEKYKILSSILGILFTLIYFIGYPTFHYFNTRGMPRAKGVIIDEENSWFPGMRELTIQFDYEGEEYLIKHVSNEENSQRLGTQVEISINTKNLNKSTVESSGSYWISIGSGLLILGICLYNMCRG